MNECGLMGGCAPMDKKGLMKECEWMKDNRWLARD